MKAVFIDSPLWGSITTAAVGSGRVHRVTLEGWAREWWCSLPAGGRVGIVDSRLGDGVPESLTFCPEAWTPSVGERLVLWSEEGQGLALILQLQTLVFTLS